MTSLLFTNRLWSSLLPKVNKAYGHFAMKDNMSNMNQGPPPCPPPSYSQVMAGPPNMNPYGPQPTAPQGYPPIITTVIPLGPNSTRMMCPSCHGEITTATYQKPGMIAYVSGLVIALLGGWCGCCLIPCCIDDCMDVHHNCPNCGSYLGRFRR